MSIVDYKRDGATKQPFTGGYMYSGKFGNIAVNHNDGNGGLSSFGIAMTFAAFAASLTFIFARNALQQVTGILLHTNEIGPIKISNLALAMIAIITMSCFLGRGRK